MHDSLRATRAGLHLALAYTAPLALWLLGQVWLTAKGQGVAGPVIHPLLICLLWLQAGALVLCTPWLLRYREGRQRFCGMTMLVLTPLPLYSIAWATGAMEVRNLLLAGVFLAGLALCLCGFFHQCINRIPAGQARSLAIPGAQWALLLLGWVYRADWLGALGL